MLKVCGDWPELWMIKVHTVDATLPPASNGDRQAHLCLRQPGRRQSPPYVAQTLIAGYSGMPAV